MGIKRVQKIVESILYYTCAVDMTVSIALRSIAVKQTQATKKAMARCTQVLDYLSSQADAKVQFHTLEMIMNIHSDALHLSKANARSRACGSFFMQWMPKDGEPIQLNGAFHVSTTMMHFFVASANVAKLNALYHDCQTGIIFCLTLAEMGHPQPRIPIHCDSTTADALSKGNVQDQWK